MRSVQCPYLGVSWILFTLWGLILAIIGQTTADRSYTIYSSKNKTLPVYWTVGSTESNHVLRCIADGDPLPNLHWVRDTENFTVGNDTILVDQSNVHNISISFKEIGYNIINDYYCFAINPVNNSLISKTYFRMSVTVPTSGGMVFLVLIMLVAFIAGAITTCRILKFNDVATRIET